MFWYDHDVSAWGWIGMSAGMIAFWVLVVGVVIWLLRTSRRREEQDWTPQLRGPEQLLAERFARGEIDEAEYRDRLAILRGDSRPVVKS